MSLAGFSPNPKHAPSRKKIVRVFQRGLRGQRGVFTQIPGRTRNDRLEVDPCHVFYVLSIYLCSHDTIQHGHDQGGAQQHGTRARCGVRVPDDRRGPCVVVAGRVGTRQEDASACKNSLSFVATTAVLLFF